MTIACQAVELPSETSAHHFTPGDVEVVIDIITESLKHPDPSRAEENTCMSMCRNRYCDGLTSLHLACARRHPSDLLALRIQLCTDLHLLLDVHTLGRRSVLVLNLLGLYSGLGLPAALALRRSFSVIATFESLLWLDRGLLARSVLVDTSGWSAVTTLELSLDLTPTSLGDRGVFVAALSSDGVEVGL